MTDRPDRGATASRTPAWTSGVIAVGLVCGGLLAAAITSNATPSSRAQGLSAAGPTPRFSAPVYLETGAAPRR